MLRIASLAVLGLGVAFGCSAGRNSTVVVGDEGAGGARIVPSGAGGSGTLQVGDASVARVLAAHVESPRGVTVTFVTLSCAGDCADVLAVATGGFAPYSYSWEDGSTDPARRVCPTASASYRVSVTDAGSSSGEFKRAPATASAPLTAKVLDCADGGRADAGGTGGTGGATDSGPLCIQNPSLEGTPQVTPFSPFAAAPWSACPSGVNAGTVVNETASSAVPYPVASDGSTYGTIGTNSGFGGLSILSQELCEPIAAGKARSFQVDLARMVYGSGVEAKIAQVQVFGDSSVCGSRELLWTSPDLRTTFSTYCVTLRPGALTSAITFSPLGDQNPLFNGLMTALVDHIVPVAACP